MKSLLQHSMNALRLLALFLMVLPATAWADTYQVFDIGGPRQIYGIDTVGNVVIHDIASSCDTFDDPCYDLFHLGMVISFSVTAPELTHDEGGPCSTVDTGNSHPALGISVCNGNREAFWADYGWTSGLFSGPDPYLDLVYNGPVSFLIMNAHGDMAFRGDDDYQAINVTPQTPEPQAWLLVGTGVLCAAGAVRRYLARNRVW
jgi:hypothetical protein